MVVQHLDFQRLLLALLAAGLILILLPQNRAPDTPLADLQPMLVAPTAPPAMTFVPPTAMPTSAQVGRQAPLPVYGPAAELHAEKWFNLETPPHLADLRGQVVLLEFWSFDCANCQEVLTQVRQWYDAYAAQGLTIIGVHDPQTDAERSDDNLAAALVRLDIPYPVAQDSDQSIWHAYGQHVLPTIDLIDKRGYLRYRHVDPGAYDQTEAAIQALLAENTP